jgi:hypothetical protein
MLALIIEQLANEQKNNYNLLINTGFKDEDDFDEAFEEINEGK